MRITHSPIDALLSHRVLGLEWSNHQDEKQDGDKFRDKAIHRLHPTYYATYLSQQHNLVHFSKDIETL